VARFWASLSQCYSAPHDVADAQDFPPGVQREGWEWEKQVAIGWCET